MAKVTGGGVFSARLTKLGGPGKISLVAQALAVAAEKIEVHAAFSLEKGSVSGANHVPSAPGQPPNSDTQVLQKNIETNQIGPLKYEVSSNAVYSAALEFGTSRMEARPFMRPAALALKDEAVALVERAIREAAK